MLKILTLKKSHSLDGIIVNYHPHYFDEMYEFSEIK